MWLMKCSIQLVLFCINWLAWGSKAPHPHQVEIDQREHSEVFGGAMSEPAPFLSELADDEERIIRAWVVPVTERNLNTHANDPCGLEVSISCEKNGEECSLIETPEEYDRFSCYKSVRYRYEIHASGTSDVTLTSLSRNTSESFKDLMTYIPSEDKKIPAGGTLEVSITVMVNFCTQRILTRTASASGKTADGSSCFSDARYGLSLTWGSYTGTSSEAVPTEHSNEKPSTFRNSDPYANLTKVPSRLPTPCPTREEISVPTSEPTTLPIAEPTPEPTSEPLREPTGETANRSFDSGGIPGLGGGLGMPSSVAQPQPNDTLSLAPNKTLGLTEALVPQVSPNNSPTDQQASIPTSGITQIPAKEPAAIPTSAATMSPEDQPVLAISGDTLITEAQYDFEIEIPLEINLNEVLTSVSEIVESALQNQMALAGSQLNELVQSYGAQVESVFPLGTEQNTTGVVASNISTVVAVSHLAISSPEFVQFVFFSNWHHIYNSLYNSLPYPSTYTGIKTLTTDLIVVLKGVPPAIMEENDMKTYEEVLKRFLSPRLKESGVDLVDVSVLSQRLILGTRSFRALKPCAREGNSLRRTIPCQNKDDRQLSNESAELEVTTQITGMHRPPPHHDMDKLIEDSINADGETLVGDLKSYEGNYFNNIEDVSTQFGVETAPTSSPVLMVPSGVVDGNGSIVSAERSESFETKGGEQRRGLAGIIAASVSATLLGLLMCKASHWFKHKRTYEAFDIGQS